MTGFDESGNPLDGLDEEEQKHLASAAERAGISLEEARKRREHAAACLMEALEPYKQHLADLAEAEKRMVPLLRASGVEVSGIGTALLAAEAGFGAITGGSKGGRQTKRRPWAEWACQFAKSWEDFPSSEEPWRFRDWEIYRDGDELIAVDYYTEKETTLSRSTVEKRYLK